MVGGNERGEKMKERKEVRGGGGKRRVLHREMEERKGVREGKKGVRLIDGGNEWGEKRQKKSYIDR